MRVIVRNLILASCVLCGVAAPAVAGTLSLTAGPTAVLSGGLAPGSTVSGTGSLTATDTNPSWTLQVQDTGSGAGHLVAGTTGCAGSDAQLSNPLMVQVTSLLGGVNSAGSVAIGASPATVASASSQLLASSVLTTTFTQTVPASEQVRSGCVYSLTATFTLQ